MIEILGYSALGIFLAGWFTPLNTVKNWLYKKLKYPGWFEHLYCVKCVTFWTTLIISQNVFTACIAAILAYITNKIIDNYGE